MVYHAPGISFKSKQYIHLDVLLAIQRLVPLRVSFSELLVNLSDEKSLPEIFKSSLIVGCRVPAHMSFIT